jgi:hypothetical protein
MLSFPQRFDYVYKNESPDLFGDKSGDFLCGMSTIQLTFLRPIKKIRFHSSAALQSHGIRKGAWILSDPAAGEFYQRLIPFWPT